MDNPIDKAEFTIFDTETTGLDYKSGDRVVELAAVRFKGEESLCSFDSLVNPGRPVSPQAFSVNKISEEMLLSAPPPGEVIPGFLDFIKESILCSYNAGFDLGFLNNELRLLGREGVRGIIVLDILRIARHALPALESYSLAAVALRLGIKIKQSHRALCDVELTLKVFNRLKAIIETRAGCRITLEKIINMGIIDVK
ncbi:MAG: 3'-5' exonuclease [Candidatus Omnitrophica bacterium]|jgi:DNA polymerase III epsilon subunit family exonuclease|nr:3'-5' exonuclease [Candidatus Omnitrophota bacterium]MDD4981352.1 3'-5' exonuclease [Candidatus Omnitrophota bacterium]